MPEFVLVLHGGWSTAQQALIWVAIAGWIATGLCMAVIGRAESCSTVRPGYRHVPALCTFGPVEVFAFLGLPLIHWLLPAVHTTLARIGVGVLGLLASFAAIAAAFGALMGVAGLIILGAELTSASRENRRPFHQRQFPPDELPPTAHTDTASPTAPDRGGADA